LKLQTEARQEGEVKFKKIVVEDLERLPLSRDCRRSRGGKVLEIGEIRTIGEDPEVGEEALEIQATTKTLKKLTSC
jgi:hypothetical protein